MEHSSLDSDEIVTLRLKIAQKTCIIRSLGPNALKYQALEP